MRVTLLINSTSTKTLYEDLSRKQTALILWFLAKRRKFHSNSQITRKFTKFANLEI